MFMLQWFVLHFIEHIPKMTSLHQGNLPIIFLQLNDFLHFVSIFSSKIQDNKALQTEAKLFNWNFLSETLLFIDQSDRKKLRLSIKSTNVFSRLILFRCSHLLINSIDAFHLFISKLIQAEQWLILCQVQPFQRFPKRSIDQSFVFEILSEENFFSFFVYLSWSSHFLWFNKSIDSFGNSAWFIECRTIFSSPSLGYSFHENVFYLFKVEKICFCSHRFFRNLNSLVKRNLSE